MQKVKRSKINYSIKTSFQIRLFLKIALIILLSIAVTSGVFYFYSNREIGDSFTRFHVTARNFLDYLLPSVIASGILGLIIALAITIFFPHSIAGPLYRIEKDIKEKIGESGDLTFRFNLRNGDELKDLADSLNIMLEKVNSNIMDVESIAAELLRLASSSDKIDTKDLRAVHDSLRGIIQKFKIRRT